MSNRFLLKSILLTTISVSVTAFMASAQVNTAAITTSGKGLSTDDSLALKKVVLPFNTITTPNATTAATQAIYNQQINRFPVVNALNTLSGSIAGLYTQQNSGQPGADDMSLTLRGRTPILIVDGIPRIGNFSNLDLQSIESITVLKDAMATGLLGVRGANGAIVITTRQGSTKEQAISFTVQSAFQQPINMPKPLGAYDYATLRNEAVNNELRVNPNFNTGLRYSDGDLQAYQTGDDPYGHPDIDWRKQILKSSAQLNRYTLNMSGGNSTVTYYAGIEHLSQDGLLKTNSANTYNTSNYLKSYLIRSNVNINFTSKLSGGIRLYGRMVNVNDPGSTTVGIFNSLLSTPNNAYPVLNPNGSLAGTAQFPNNIQGQSTSSGYLQNFTREISADFYIKRTLDEITKGLYFKGLVSYSSYLTENINRSKPVVAYQRFVSSTGVESYSNPLTQPAVQLNTNSISNSTTPGLGQGRQSYAEVSFGYGHTFNNNNHLDAVLLANTDNNVYGSNLGYNVAGFSARASYDYAGKYTAEISAAYNGSNYYPTGSTYKFGFFPVVGLGWNITTENFMKQVKWINFLRLSANYGRTGNNNPGYFSYIQRIFNAGTPYFGTSAGANTTLAESTLANPDITWEKATELNVELRGAMLNSKLGFSIDYFNNRFSDVLTQPGRNTALLGNFYPNLNIGRYKYTGFDFQLSWQNPKTGDLGYYISANVGLQQSKILFIDEPNQAYSWMQRTGQKVNQPFGYTALGLFTDQNDINNAKQNGAGVVAGYVAQPGDIKYKDLNRDGVINQFDQAPIGPAGPLINYGVNLGISYKNVDFSALIQGAANYNVYLSGNSYWEFQNNGFGQAYQHHLGRFTGANAASATYPRLSIGNNVNNGTFSTYWYSKADYLRLKNVEIGYTLPSKYAHVIKLKSMRLFASGTNILTITKLKGGRDPEIYNGAYPLQRLWNLGVSVKL